MQRITLVLLSQFAKLSRYRFKPILVIAATNMPWMIDNAFLRPGRLDKVLYVGLLRAYPKSPAALKVIHEHAK